MSTETRRVGVLAKLHHSVFCDVRANYQCSCGYDEAIAAVAGLIEATRALYERAEFEGFGREASSEMSRVSAALARLEVSHG
jgi:hypothetical protein